MSNDKSNCCGAEMRVNASDEGTCCHVCTQCGNACDATIPTPRTDADEVLELEGNWDTKALRLHAYAKRLERELAVARAENDALRKDKERLDWMDDPHEVLWVDVHSNVDGESIFSGRDDRDVRAAIDAAMEGSER